VNQSAMLLPGVYDVACPIPSFNRARVPPGPSSTMTDDVGLSKL